MEVAVVDRQRGRPGAGRGLGGFVRRLIVELPPPRATHMTVCLVSSARMRTLNRTYRGQDRPTDVLSFPGDGLPEADGSVYLGDLAIAVPVAEAQARRAGHTLSREVKRLALHGYLHLLGYDHETDDGRMRRLERRLVRRLLPATSETGS